MATYKDSSVLFQDNSAAFDKVHHPGAIPLQSGIYRCQGCGVEIVAEQARSFPPTRACHEHHPKGKHGAVLWKLIVYADHTGA